MRYAAALAAAVGFVSAGRAADRYAARNGQAPESPYATWATAASNIQDAVNAAAANDTVWVGAGVYTVPPNATNYMGTNVVFINRPLVLIGSNGAPREAVVIDGGGSNRGLVMNCTLGSTNRVVLDGLTITAGYATNQGGAIYVMDGNYASVVQNCLLEYNTAASSGGAITTPEAWSSLRYLFSNCVFRGNQALSGGAFNGFVRKAGYGGTVAHCLIESNQATAGYGAGLLFNTGSNIVDHCVVRANRATAQGCGIMARGGYFALRNSLVCRNVAGGAGGGLYLEASLAAFIQHSTIVSNAGTSGGIRSQEMSVVLQLCNAIVYSNANVNVSGGTVSYTNVCITPLVAGEGVVTNPPAFADFANGDFRLSGASPCVNAGTNLEWAAEATDLAGRPRIDRFFRRADLGCYEHVVSGALVGLR